MKVYIVFYAAYLSNSEFLDVFATREAAERWIEIESERMTKVKYTIEEWGVRGD